MASASKYVIPTGPGYLGVASVREYTVDICLAACTAVDWDPTTSVSVVDSEDEPGLQVTARPHEDAIGEANLRKVRAGINLYVGKRFLTELEGFDGDGQLRFYDHPIGLTLVPQQNDPLVDTGGHTDD